MCIEANIQIAECCLCIIMDHNTASFKLSESTHFVDIVEKKVSFYMTY